MKYYTDSIPPDLAMKLKAAGMIINSNRIWFLSYAIAFDWLSKDDPIIEVTRVYDNDGNKRYMGIYWTNHGRFYTTDFATWHEAANAAIEKVLELIKEK